MALVHGQGAVHRDLKSDNILVDRRGVVRVVDFGLASYADRRLGFAPGAMGTFTYMAPETVLGRSTPASDVYSLGLLMYELFTGGGPHLTAAWSTDDQKDHRDQHYELKKSLRFPPPSDVQNEIRNDYRWLDALILRCLEIDPRGASRTPASCWPPSRHARLAANRLCRSRRRRAVGVNRLERSRRPPTRRRTELFREARRFLAGKKYDEAIDRLDVHRPPEWVVLDRKGARTLRMLGQAFLGRGDLAAARDCLEQLRDAQRQQALLSRPDYAAALSDLVKCYRGLGMVERARACQEEARGLL